MWISRATADDLLARAGKPGIEALKKDPKPFAMPGVTVDLAVAKSVGEPSPAEGDTIQYTVRLSNVGLYDATGVVVTDLLPAELTYRSHVTTAPGHPDAGTVALTGFEENPKPVQPNFGSIVAKHRGLAPDGNKS